MKTSDFDYELPQSFIAQAPAEPRDACKLLVCHAGDEAGQRTEHRIFRDIIDYLEPGDLLVANETRVLPARLFARKATGAACELLLLNKLEEESAAAGVPVWEALAKPGKRLKPGAEIEFVDLDGQPTGAFAQVSGLHEETGARHFTMCGQTNESFDALIHRIGATPLPPYITEYAGDQEMYQTVYSATERSAAAPTAGLHFTEELLAKIRAKGVGFATVDLEVGLDTFRTVSEEDPLRHVMHTERYSVSPQTVAAIEATKRAGGRVIAVGTTSVRSLESAAQGEGLTPQARAATNLFIYPGYEFRVVDAIITNFHIPRSTLMMLVSAYAGRTTVLNAYEEAKREGYRFFSFGDAMLLVR